MARKDKEQHTPTLSSFDLKRHDLILVRGDVCKVWKVDEHYVTVYDKFDQDPKNYPYTGRSACYEDIEPLPIYPNLLMYWFYFHSVENDGIYQMRYDSPERAYYYDFNNHNVFVEYFNEHIAGVEPIRIVVSENVQYAHQLQRACEVMLGMTFEDR